MLGKLVGTLKEAAINYVSDDCLSRGAAIAFYTMFSLPPILIIVIAIAAVVFGEATARAAIINQVRTLISQQGADAVQTMIASAQTHGNGLLGGAIGIVSFLLTATGVFTEMQTALNVIWKAGSTLCDGLATCLGASAKPGPRGGSRILVDGIAHCQYGARCRGRLVERFVARWALITARGEFSRIPRADRGCILCNLQGATGRHTQLAGFGRWRAGHVCSVRGRQVPDQPLPGKQQHNLFLRSGRGTRYRSPVGLLFEPDCPSGGRTDAGLGQPTLSQFATTGSLSRLTDRNPGTHGLKMAFS